MRRLRLLAITTTALTYFLIFVGGLVRVSGAGLGCPDWPRCFGRWIPPTRLDQLPPEFDPSTFNITLAWIEYVNRLVGVVVGLFILALAIVVVIYYRRHKRLLTPAILALILVAIQGWQGSIVVAMGLDPAVVNIHLYTALIIAGFLVYLTQQTFYLDPERNDERHTRYSPGLANTLVVLFLVVMVQVILGSQVRAGFEFLMQTLRFVGNLSVMELIGPGVSIHMWVGVLVLLLGGILIYQLRYTSESVSTLMAVSATLVVILMVGQVILGFSLMRVGLPPIMQLYHLWMGSILMGTVLVMITALQHNKELKSGS